MKIGDLVYWHDKKSLLGIIIEATKQYNDGDPLACRVQWANGATSNHSAKLLGLAETSENT
tara:strand:- start:754 stop:936 length:183 start_codon:yes stop_codon:yes gene_type:complete